MRCSDGSRKDKLSIIGEAFLNEKDASWTKIYMALREAECHDMAKIIETCFLPL